MNKNKEKKIIGGEDVSHLEKATPAKTRLARMSLKPSIPSSFGKRKVATKAVDKSNLPNCHNPKKTKNRSIQHKQGSTRRTRSSKP